MRNTTRRAQRAVLQTTAVAMAALSTSALFDSPYQLLYNPSPSAPRGWYLRVPIAEPRRGSLVVLHLPNNVATFAAARAYLPHNVPVLKHIAAAIGDTVCEQDGTVQINGDTLANALSQDAAARPLTPWTGCRKLTSNEVFVLNTPPDSFDSRYYGPLPITSILGRAIPLKTEPTPSNK